MKDNYARMFENYEDVYARCNFLEHMRKNWQSAAKLRIGEGSTTIPLGSRLKRVEMGNPKPLMRHGEDIVCTFSEN